MIMWGASRRDSDTILAIWPTYRFTWERWIMLELAEKPDGTVQWRERRIPTPEGHVKMDAYAERAEAFAAADALNPQLAAALAARPMDEVARASLTLKVRKGLQAKRRLMEEEALMLAEAVRRHAQAPRLDPSALKIAPASEPQRQALAAQLAQMPYLRLVLIGGHILYRGVDEVWSRPYPASERSAQAAIRARIANGFGFHHDQHWGQVKARIRAMLLPRANQLLQLASVRRLLAEALAAGQHVLVSNGIVFWYEPDGQLGWQVKETSSDKGQDGAAIWKEGTIHSINHGRLVILPYIKENGEKVRGHTRNAPGDGRAKPRHRDHYVDIPFGMLDGDLMIGLFGELPYE